MWCDASSIATAVVLQSGDEVLEDAAWLRKKNDHTHINVAELEAAVKGLNLCLKWGFTRFRIITDSATVYGWLQSVLTGSHRPRTHSLSEMLVKRRLSMVSETVSEFGAEVSVSLVPSEQNKADPLSRVPKSWLAETTFACALAATSRYDLEASHRQHHFCTRRSTEVAQHQPGRHIDKAEMQDVVRQCVECQTIDPSSVRWSPGTLAVEKTWQRVAIDTTHYKRHLFLTLCDCGPSRFAIWRRIPSEDEATVAKQLEAVFCEYGPPDELLLDNSASFRSALVRKACEAWNVRLRFRCAYRPSGNGIVERNHRTVKRIAERAQISPERAVFWYNATSGESGHRASDLVFRHSWRIPKLPSRSPLDEAAPSGPTRSDPEDDDHGDFATNESCETDERRYREAGDTGREDLGDTSDEDESQPSGDHRSGSPVLPAGTEVVVRPPNSRCTTRTMATW